MVTEAEAGQKLLQLLERRLHLAPSLLHRWIRTGQIRCNAARCKPFDRICAGTFVRIPPFAWKMAQQSVFERSSQLPPLPPEVGRHGQLVAYLKPAGLPTHPGSAHTDSLAARLKQHAGVAPFVPVPAHRLDKDTQGLLLVATSHAALRSLQAQIRAGQLSKEYLCWVQGLWPWRKTRLLRHYLSKSWEAGFEKVRVFGLTAGSEERPMGKLAETLVAPLAFGQDCTLLLVRILTGRTHQIRAQMAHLGYPLLGDAKYGSSVKGPLYLCAFRLTLPDGFVFATLPDWPEPFTVHELPSQSLSPTQNIEICCE
ncbi:MAG: RluA family pseudouridine synthase [Desulfovibrio sp.]|nr:RluA family pseudouridine synthase [Desulfovibrio sp.]